MNPILRALNIFPLSAQHLDLELLHYFPSLLRDMLPTNTMFLTALFFGPTP